MPNFLSTLLAKVVLILVEAVVAEIVFMLVKSLRARRAATA
ncbi:hypothetical protein [Marinactinospora rubrisoli]